MSDLARAFPHTRLKFLKSGTAIPGRSPRPSKQSIANSGNRDGHGRSLKSSVSTIAASWQSTLETRKKEGLPDLPNALPLILQVDPKVFNSDALKSFGIEVTLELEDGYILGSAIDTDLTKLQQKISQFIAGDRGGGKIMEIWQILEGRLERLEYILSPDLLTNWAAIVDEQSYTVDVSIACVGVNPKFSEFPREKEGRDPVKSAILAARWLDKREQTMQDWDALQWDRELDFKKFVAYYEGKILQKVSYDDLSRLNLLPDSFSCRIKISGKGLKDIALNHPYVFEISDSVEVIPESGNSHVLGSSINTGFTKLQKKIIQFITENVKDREIAETWKILEGKFGGLEYILSSDLIANWDNIIDDQLYTIDVTIACVGIDPKFFGFPEEREGVDSAKSAILIAQWLDKRDQTLQEWDDLLDERETDFRNFVSACGGSIPQGTMYDDRSHLNLLPDSFSCQVEVSGKGLKDIALNYPYIVEISEPKQIINLDTESDNLPESPPGFILQTPSADAPKICIIDSGIQENHPLLKAAVDYKNSRSWVPSQSDFTADQVQDGGHGTKVAGAFLYPQGIPPTSTQEAIGWIQNARVLDKECQLSEKLHIPDLLRDIVAIYYRSTGTRIFNQSISDSSPCRMTYMSAWAATIDYLSWQNDILFIVAAGNIPINRTDGLSSTRDTLEEHNQAGRLYPEYLLQASARIANPAQSFQALTVGSIAHTTYSKEFKRSVAEANHPSAFSCTGYGIWDSIKPDVVEYGGDLAIDSDTEPNFSTPAEICPELVRTTEGGAPAVASDSIGTSFAAPKVAHIAAALEATFPQASCLLYRALIVQSARLPEWTDDPAVNLSDVIRMMGYGLPNLARAVGNSDDRITLITQEEKFIQARQAHIYQVGIPPELQSPADDFDIRVEITLSYKAEPRRTRRSKRKYLSTWLHWECSHKGELPDAFLTRVLKNHETSDSNSDSDGLFSWTLGQQKNHGNKVKDTSRSIGTIQKDWTTIKSFNLREKFCIAVVAH